MNAVQRILKGRKPRSLRILEGLWDDIKSVFRDPKPKFVDSRGGRFRVSQTPGSNWFDVVDTQTGETLNTTSSLQRAIGMTHDYERQAKQEGQGGQKGGTCKPGQNPSRDGCSKRQ